MSLRFAILFVAAVACIVDGKPITGLVILGALFI
jgi:hypothetical protein